MLLGARLLVLLLLATCRTSRSSSSSRPRSSSKEKTDYEKRKQEYLAFRNEVNALLEEQKELLRVLPKTDDIEQFIENVQAQIELAGLSKVASVRDAAQPVEMYVKIPIRMSLTGTYHQINHFFKNVGELQAHRQHRGPVARSGRRRRPTLEQRERCSRRTSWPRRSMFTRQGAWAAAASRGTTDHVGRWPLSAPGRGASLDRVLLVAGCGNDAEKSSRAAAASRRRRGRRRRRAGSPVAALQPRRRAVEGGAAGRGAQARSSPTRTSTRATTNRDPFRSFLTTFATQAVNVSRSTGSCSRSLRSTSSS